MLLGRIVILGVHGGFGRRFARHFADDGATVLGVDLAPEPDPEVPCDDYRAGDASDPGGGWSDLLPGADCVLLCLPEEAAWRALERVVPELDETTLSVDTLSVKLPVEERLASVVADVRREHLGLNPLFAPELGFAGHHVAAVPRGDGPRAAAFLERLTAWGATVRSMDAATHDRLAAATQAATHAAVLAFGSCLERLGEEPDDLLAVSTPPFLTLLALFARIVSRDPGVYWSIQADNRLARPAREALVEAASELARTVEAGNRAAWDAAFEAARRRLGEHLETLDACSTEALEAAVSARPAPRPPRARR